MSRRKQRCQVEWPRLVPEKLDLHNRMMIKMLKTTDFYAMVKAYRKTLITNDMKKVFCIFLSLIALMGLSACEPETPGNPQKPDPEESSYLTFVSSRESSVALVKVGEPFDISLEHSIDGKSWNPYTIGEAIYLLKNEELILGPFQGKIACTNIPLTKGVCGKAASSRETVLVEDVHQFEGHIACDSESNSEIVVPLIKNYQLYGVLDLDSTSFGRFSKEDQIIFEEIAEILVQHL